MKIPNYPRIYVFLLVAFLVILLGDSGNATTGHATPINQKNLQKIAKIQCGKSHPLRFVVLGDSRSNPKIFSQIINLTNSLKPDFVIHTGDIVEKGEKSEFDKVRPLFNQFNAPILAVPGNHDFSFTTKKLNNFTNYFGKNEMIVDICGVRLIMLDNSKGILTRDQLSRLRNDLNTDDIRMIFMHVPPNPPWPQHTFLTGAKDLVNMIKETGCEYAFFGHVHGYDHKMIGEKCNAYITGGAGAELGGQGFAQEIYHVLLVTVDGKKVDVKMVPLEQKKAPK